MNSRQIGRIFGALGGLLLASCLITGLLGVLPFLKVKLVIALVCFIIFFATNWRHLGTSSAGHGSFYAGVTILSCVGLAALLCVANYAAYKRPKTWDLTVGKVNGLSDESLAILKTLPQPVKATAFYRSAEPERQELEGIFEKCTVETELFTYEFVDPVSDPIRAAKAEIKSDGPRVIFESGDLKARVQEITEEAIANGIRQVVQQERTNVFFSINRGESRLGDTGENGLSKMAEKMKAEGLDASETKLDALDALDASAKALVIAGPREDFSTGELDAIRDFLLSGGRALFLLDPLSNAHPTLDQFLTEFDVAVDRQVISDPVNHLAGASPELPMITDYNASEEITQSFTLPTVFPGVSPVRILTEDMHSGIWATRLAFTSDKAVAHAILEESTAPKAEEKTDDGSIEAEGESSPEGDDEAHKVADDVVASGEGSVAPSATEDVAQDAMENTAPNDATATLSPTPSSDRPSEAPQANEAQRAEVVQEGTLETSAPTDQVKNGPFAIAVRVSGRLPPVEEGGPDREFRIVVIGDASFAQNSFAGAMGNSDLFLNTLNWLTGRSERITIRPRARVASALMMTPERQGQLYFLILDLLPLTILAFGIALWMMRRSR